MPSRVAYKGFQKKTKTASTRVKTNINVNEKPKDEHNVQFCRNQMKNFELTIQKYKNKCDQLELDITKYKSQYDAIVVEEKDIVAYLNKELANKNNECIGLSKKLNDVTIDKQNAEKDFKHEKDVMRKEYLDRVESLSDENEKLSKLIKSIRIMNFFHNNRYNNTTFPVVYKLTSTHTLS